MRIVINSSTFLPNLGGLERIMSGLAEEFVTEGQEVQVITTTKDAGANKDYTYQIARTPSWEEIYKYYQRADVILEANISLKSVLLGMLFFRKWFVVHHIHYQHGKGFFPLLKNFFTLFSKNIAVSNFIKQTLWGKALTIPNFYQAEFRLMSAIPRNKDLVFVGRWVSDKGGAVLLKAMAQLKQEGLQLECTFVGMGPEESNYKALVTDLQLGHQVHFMGPLQGEALLAAYNQHQVAVIPSTWQEPFGLVALEAMACGCKVVASNTGGLTEAGGKWAHYAAPGDVKRLALAIKKAHEHQQTEKEVAEIQLHLKQHQRKRIAGLYLDYFREKLNTR